MKKYTLLKDDTITIDGHTLYRIQALIDIPSALIKAGDLGGYIESERNLSQEGKCWVFKDAQVFGSANISENAEIAGSAKVCGNATVFGKALISKNANILGHAKIYENAVVCGYVIVFGSASISGNVKVYGSAKIYGDAKISGSAKIYENATVFGSASISGKAQVFGSAKIYGDSEVFGSAKISENAEIAGSTKINGDEMICDNESVLRSFLTFKDEKNLKENCPYNHDSDAYVRLTLNAINSLKLVKKIIEIAESKEESLNVIQFFIDNYEDCLANYKRMLGII